MNILIIVLSLISAYVLFVSASYLLAKLLFPKIEVDDLQEEAREVKAKMIRLRQQRRLTRAIR